MANQQICLKWSGFHSNITTSFECLWEEQGLVDVTLASDGQCIRAHKVILSACSPLFKIMFETNPCQHPVVILQDIRFSEIESILAFVYKGEVNIDQVKLQSLLRAAETLQIRGLSGASEEVQQKLCASQTANSEKPQNRQHIPAAVETLDGAPPCKRQRSVLKRRSPPPPPTATPSKPISHPSRQCASPVVEPNIESEEVTEAAFPCNVEVIESETSSPPMIGVEEIRDHSNDDSMDLMAKNILMEEHLTEVAFEFEMNEAGNDGAFHIGAQFSSFAEFETKYNAWVESGHHPMKITNSSTNRRLPSEAFPYHTISYTCKHYGTPRLRGTNKRPKQKYYAKGCPVIITVTKNRKGSAYIVTQVNTKHNHPVSAEIRKQYPDKRMLLSEAEMQDIAQLVEQSASIKTIRDYASEYMGRLLTRNDVHALRLKVDVKKNVKKEAAVCCK